MTRIEIPTTYEDTRSGEAVVVLPGEHLLPGMQEVGASTRNGPGDSSPWLTAPRH